MQKDRSHVEIRSEAIRAQLVEWRRHFHGNPELSFHEKETAEYIVEILQSMGVFTLQTGIAGNGIVATLSSGDGPVIGLRADMDALPIMEQTNAAFSSNNDGVMHACGHDAHMAILLGVAKLLAEDYKKGKLTGTVKLIFQPAEESADAYGLTGAPYFLKAGVIDDLNVALALHVCPWRNTGDIQINKGPSMANIDNFSLQIKGKGGHGGYPHQSKDPIWMASFILQGIYGLISRKVNPLEVGVISVGEIHGGNTANVIPEVVQIKGTLRSYTTGVRKQLMEELENIASIVESLGGEFILDIEHGEPALNNDPFLTGIIRKTAQSLYPSMSIYEEAFGMGGEDFGHITKKFPGAMFFLGCAREVGDKGSLHASDFMINEDALPIGVSILTACTQKLLGDNYLDGGGYR
ncbi:M20 metallopeptidase family protein [Aquibacillus kalidii]|uniref:M20 metallopeptidase family protein n=1 Tax=Aquibacillus kalidii TaxID=2762597 RepID=UPI001C998284|nr:amidohydrolase [Aquibacillus kalidii]